MAFSRRPAGPAGPSSPRRPRRTPGSCAPPSPAGAACSPAARGGTVWTGTAGGGGGGRGVWGMGATPHRVIEWVVRSVCGREVERLVRLTGGGLNETYRVEVPNDVPVVVRIARQPVPWFTDEEHVMAQARGVGVPTPDVLGVEQVDHDGELLSFSILRLV